RVRSETGLNEYFDENNELFQCTGRFYGFNLPWLPCDLPATIPTIFATRPKSEPKDVLEFKSLVTLERLSSMACFVQDNY
ncbi:hypothetical protein E2562_010331, partial [Oryza meyeriana var. granulata]